MSEVDQTESVPRRNRLPIVVARNGTACVIRWTGDISLLPHQLKEPHNCLTARLGVNMYLVSVGSADIDTIAPYRVGDYETQFDKNSFLIPRQLTMDEQEKLDNIIATLVINGIIGGSGIHQKSTKAGTFVNFPYGRNRDCEMVKLFMGY